MVLTNWQLDGKPVTVPNVWGVERDLRWEGPAVYETSFVADTAGWLIFHGVSALARVYVNDALACEHLAIWDAFSVPIQSAGEIQLRVEVIKNGGETIPVSSIASGFLPFVFGTFGGIYKPVEFSEKPLSDGAPAKIRARFQGHKLLVDDVPIFLRGILHWGWYPELRHPAPNVETVRSEITAVKQMGFNCVKFCLWVPPHYYLEELERADMLAWMELPIWNPGQNVEQFKSELERIVKQYRHHRSIILWTIGCELGHQMTREGRRDLFEHVKEWTGGALLKDSSGGAEMYGGDPVEFGDFEDFHPYCDLSEYPKVLDSLQAGPRSNKAILLGECNDFDSHRDLPRVLRESPYWASADPALNDQGVRWQFDLSNVLANSRFARDEEAGRKLKQQSLEMKLFVHRTFQEWLRAREFSGSVITGIADTPISTSGFFDDWGQSKFTAEQVREFMGPDLFFLIPQRRLPWIDGGNRVGIWDAWHVFDGWNRVRIGLHSEAGFEGDIEWRIGDQSGGVSARVIPLEPAQVLDIAWFAEPDTSYRLEVISKENSQSWPIESVLKPTATEPITVHPNGSIPAPAFREAAYEFLHPELDRIFSGKPHTLYAALSNLFLNANNVEGGEPLMVRVDTRTYRELPVVVMDEGNISHSLRNGADPAAVLVQRALARIARE